VGRKYECNVAVHDLGSATWRISATAPGASGHLVLAVEKLYLRTRVFSVAPPRTGIGEVLHRRAWALARELGLEFASAYFTEMNAAGIAFARNRFERGYAENLGTFYVYSYDVSSSTSSPNRSEDTTERP
jgi:hypothetical protein